jgi:hypothetical protein
MKTLYALLVLALAAPSLRAHGLSEGLRFDAASSFSALPALKAPRLRPSLRLEAADPAPVKKQGTRHIRLSGWVHLSGSGFAPQQSGFATVTVSGYANLSDQNGSSISGSVHLSDTQSYFISGNFISGWARPYAYVSVYEGGRLLGTTRVEGSVNVTGWRNGSWINLSGSGQVSGDLYVNDPAPSRD